MSDCREHLLLATHQTFVIIPQPVASYSLKRRRRAPYNVTRYQAGNYRPPRYASELTSTGSNNPSTPIYDFVTARHKWQRKTINNECT